MNSYKVLISEALKERGAKQKISLNLSFSPVDMGSEHIVFLKPVSGELLVENVGDEVELTGTVDTRVSLTCDRCLGGFEKDVELEVFEFFQKDLTDEEDALPIEGDSIDVGHAVEQSVLLTFPIRNVCREDCRGLCPECGADLNQGDCECPPVEEGPFAQLKDLWKSGSEES